jgi:flagellar biosynthesis protein FlhA
VEPAFGLPAIWITEDRKEKAQIAGYTVVDCTTVVATHLTEMIKKHAHELIGRQEVQNLLDNMLKTYPKLVEELVPTVLSLGTIMRVLQNLLKEGVSIRDLRTILETMADWAPATQDTDILTEYVRHALSRTICSELTQNGVIPLITLAKDVEDIIQNSVQHREQGSYLAIDPQNAQKILDAIGETTNAFQGGQVPTLLVNPQIRPHVRSLTERYYPTLTIISHNEIAPNLKVKSLGTVTIHAS